MTNILKSKKCSYQFLQDCFYFTQKVKHLKLQISSLRVSGMFLQSSLFEPWGTTALITTSRCAALQLFTQSELQPHLTPAGWPENTWWARPHHRASIQDLTDAPAAARLQVQHLEEWQLLQQLIWSEIRGGSKKLRLTDLFSCCCNCKARRCWDLCPLETQHWEFLPFGLTKTSQTHWECSNPNNIWPLLPLVAHKLL